MCLECLEGLSLHMGVCLAGCPPGFKPYRGACIDNSDKDMTLLWFPFLIAAAVLILMVLFGRLKKKAALVNGHLTL